MADNEDIFYIDGLINDNLSIGAFHQATTVCVVYPKIQLLKNRSDTEDLKDVPIKVYLEILKHYKFFRGKNGEN